MDERRLDEIEARARAAKKGPWYWEGDRLISNEPAGYEDVACVIQGVPGCYKVHCHGADAEFIAASRQDVPDLCAEVRRLRKELEKARG